MTYVTCTRSGTTFCVDPETRQQQCNPLKTLAEVLLWKPETDLTGSATPCLSRHRTPVTPSTRPHTLVCHDYRGGYLEDRYLQGGQKKDAYYFSRWECIDIFVYFSHFFVTLPPLGWVRAAHKHGVQVLGTIITEWETGAAVWAEVLSSEDLCHQLVAKLVSMSKHYGFDGWLLNIENQIEAAKVPQLRDFVQNLTEEGHASLPGSRILWYDSVTKDGDLKWQNELNDSNRIFFDACDGIFLNYCWTPERLAASRQRAGERNRQHDVYVGIDVFGRGCPGGGGFNTREAFQTAWDNDLSAALFAPAWVMETLGEDNFDENDARFWTHLQDLCSASPRTSLPLASSFCQGQGDNFFCLGKMASDKPWYNMSLQQLQPECTRIFVSEDLESKPSLSTCLSSGYFGGCSLQLSAHLDHLHQTASFRLFTLWESLDQPLYCSYMYQNAGVAPCDLCIVLTMESRSSHIIMEPEDAVADRSELASVAVTGVSSKAYVKPLSGAELDVLSSSIWFHDAEVENVRDCWLSRYFKVETTHLWNKGTTQPDPEVISVGVSLSRHLDAIAVGQDVSQDAYEPVTKKRENELFSVLLGHIQIFKEKDLFLQAPVIEKITLDKLEDRENFLETGDRNTSMLPALPLPANNSLAGSSTSGSLYCLRWEVRGETGVDFFNVYLGQDGDDALLLVGHTASPVMIITLTPQHLAEGKTVAVVQPVLSSTGLPFPLSKCHHETLFIE